MYKMIDIRIVQIVVFACCFTIQISLVLVSKLMKLLGIDFSIRASGPVEYCIFKTHNYLSWAVFLSKITLNLFMKLPTY